MSDGDKTNILEKTARPSRSRAASGASVTSTPAHETDAIEQEQDTPLESSQESLPAALTKLQEPLPARSALLDAHEEHVKKSSRDRVKKSSARPRDRTGGGSVVKPPKGTVKFGKRLAALRLQCAYRCHRARQEVVRELIVAMETGRFPLTPEGQGTSAKPNHRRRKGSAYMVGQEDCEVDGEASAPPAFEVEAGQVPIFYHELEPGDDKPAPITPAAAEEISKREALLEQKARLSRRGAVGEDLGMEEYRNPFKPPLYKRFWKRVCKPIGYALCCCWLCALLAD
mmetsp:Transcript_36210/g.82531  ORF Transcript_36210/g.82531 Transcript_36210/m.82531 type:complete len:285 (+) Transcript_36210:64-918(+)